MKNIVFTVEKTSDGYTAFCEVEGMGIAATFAETQSELKKNALESYNALLFENGKGPVTIDTIALAYDIPQFFDYYKVLNTSQLAKHIPMNRTLLSQYINGTKRASRAQQVKILQGIRKLGNELAIVYIQD